MTDKWSVGGMMMGLKQPVCLDINLSQRPFVHHKFHTYCPGIKPVPPQSEAGVEPPELWRGLACMRPFYSNGSCFVFQSAPYFAVLLMSRFVGRGPRFERGLMYFPIVRCKPAVTRARIYTKNEA